MLLKEKCTLNFIIELFCNNNLRGNIIRNHEYWALVRDWSNALSWMDTHSQHHRYDSPSGRFHSNTSLDTTSQIGKHVRPFFYIGKCKVETVTKEYEPIKSDSFEEPKVVFFDNLLLRYTEPTCLYSCIPIQSKDIFH